MTRKILSICLIIFGLSSFSQSLPTISSYTVDTLCDGDIDVQFISITIEDLDGDSTYINAVTPNNAVLDGNFGFTVIDPAYVASATTRTFIVKGSAFSGLPAGINLADIEFDVIGNAVSDGGGALLNVNDIPVYGVIDVTFATNPVYVCSNGQLTDLTPNADDPSGVWSWANVAFASEPEHYTESNVFNPKIAYKVYDDEGASGYFLEYTITNSAGCSNYSMAEVLFDLPASVAMSTTPSTCLAATGSATATITGSSPYDVYWSTGFSETLTGIPTSQITNASSGVYYANITDANGCKTVAKANISDTDLAVVETINPVICAGNPGSVSLNITPTSGSVSSIYWSNGQTNALINAPAGEYSVQIHTTNNCNYYGTYVIPDSSLRIKVEYAYGNSQCFTTPDGYIDISTYGGAGPGTYSWAWTKNTLAYSTAEDQFSLAGGLYSCTLTDGTGCSVTWDKTIENYSNVYLYPDVVTKSTCGNSDGEIDITIDTSFGDIPATYTWSTGATTEDLVNVPSGKYTLTYTDQAGCESYLTVKVVDELPYQPQICLLTVDTSLTYNQIVWEKIPGSNIAGFNIYRETSTFGEFEKVATRPYALESFYMDNAASPTDRSWRYSISTYDACGNESYQSFIHKTIHTVSNSSNGTDYDVSWDDYEGINYTTVDLKRYDDTNGWTIVGSYAPGTNTAADMPPVLSGLDYLVAFNLTQTCQSTKASDYNSSRSNRTTAAFNAGGSTLALSDEPTGEIAIYPNPTNSNLTVYIENPSEFERIELRDINGKILSSALIINSNSIIEMSDFSNGLYILSLVSGDKVINHKVIKE